MSVHVSVRFLCWAMIVILPGTLLADDARSAILHAQSGVWVNGSEAHDALTIAPGDVVETKSGFVANLTTDGSTIMIQPESVVKFQGTFLVLEHGSVSVGTSKSLSVHVKCLRVVPVSDEWTQYEVTDVNGTVQAIAQKLDVEFTRESNAQGKEKESESADSIVREGEHKDREESQACGAPPMLKGASSGLPDAKWIEIGSSSVGGGVLLCVLLHCLGGGSPVSPSKP